jgi:hypothetical protein
VSDEDRHQEPGRGADGPLTPLREASEDPDARFIPGLRARINRRLLAADSVDFSLQVLFATLLGYVDVVVGSLALLGRRNKQEP